MADVFVSYKKEDRAVTERVVALLRTERRSVWWDDGLTPHQAWDATIEQQIEAARAVLVLWSPRAVASDWVRSEAHYAQEHGKLLPVVIERCTLPLAFVLRQAVDLSGSRLDPASPEWRKLDGWLDELIGREAAPTKTPPPASPALRRDSKRWVIGAAALLALALLAWLGWRQFATPARPDVVVNRLEVGRGLPAGFAADLNDEMLATFSASSRIAPREGDGRRDAGAYQLSGRVDVAGGTLRLFAKVFGPGSDAPVLTTKLERPTADIASVAPELGLTLASIVRCVATASDSSGAATTTLPLAALQGWAHFCEQSLGELVDTTPGQQAQTLRAVVAAAPRFANGWANLAEQQAITVFTGGADDRPAALREAEASVDTALKLDPSTAKAYLVKAWLQLPMVPAQGPSFFPQLRGSADWEATAQKALTARPSDCGCEVIQYGFLMNQLGRASAAIAYFERGAVGQTWGYEAEVFRGSSLAITGRATEAKQVLDPLATKWPGVPLIGGERFNAALFRGDWRTAATLLETAPEEPLKAPLGDLLRALAAGDAAGVRSGGDRIAALARTPEGLSHDAVRALSIAGRPDEALAAADRLLGRLGVPALVLLWEPTFAPSRRLPAFAALVQRTGIIAYWREPGHQPDFCKESAPPPLCATLGKRR